MLVPVPFEVERREVGAVVGSRRDRSTDVRSEEQSPIVVKGRDRERR